MFSRRRFLQSLAAGAVVGVPFAGAQARANDARPPAPLKITGLRVTPIALPDPPLLSAGGCHGPYFLRNIIQLECDGKITGIGETRGGEATTQAIEKVRQAVVGQNAFAYRSFMPDIVRASPAAWAGIELACLDACGRATHRRLCELLGGPVRKEVEFAAYLFYRYAADHPTLLADRRIVDRRGKGKDALDDWGEVRTPEAMARTAARFQRLWGFRVFKLKAGVLPPKVELETMRALETQLGRKTPLRIDPNARWRVETANAIGKELRKLNLEYYEDPVRGMQGMAEVRKATGLTMSTNMCVTRFEHVKEALKVQPIDVVLCDHHFWGGIPACQELGRICDTIGWRMSQHSNNHAGITMAAMIHVGAICRELTIASDTHYPHLPESADIIQGQKLAIRNGRMAVPIGPGVGVNLDLDKLARANEVYRKCGMRERNDAETMRMIDPKFDRNQLF
jgi:glucarate dehydratase